MVGLACEPCSLLASWSRRVRLSTSAPASGRGRNSYSVKWFAPVMQGVLQTVSLHPPEQELPELGVEVCVPPAACLILAPEGDAGEVGLVRCGVGRRPLTGHLASGLMLCR